jgi:hypothetical protein
MWGDCIGQCLGQQLTGPAQEQSVGAILPFQTGNGQGDLCKVPVEPAKSFRPADK